MLFADAVYLGIDPSSGVKPFHFAALDGKLKPLALDQGDLEAALSVAGAIKRGAVAVDAPANLSQGMMGRAKVRRRYDLPLESTTWHEWKVGEYELRRRNIRLYRTPMELEKAPEWMRQGFTLHRRLHSMGFRPLGAKRETYGRGLLEVNPQASYAVLLNRRPFAKETLEGRLQRQLVLAAEGVDLPNPMQALQGITRARLLAGQLPMEGLCSHQALDALVAAYTAFLAAENPDRTCQLGDPAEGLITLPRAELLPFYP